MDTLNLNKLIEDKRIAWSKLYDARKWREDHLDTLCKTHSAYYFITSSQSNDWVPQDIQAKMEEVHKFIETYFTDFDDKIEKLESDYNQILEAEKLACKEYKHCFYINISLYDYSNHTNKDYCVWFGAKNKKSYKKELKEALDALKTKMEELKSSEKIDSYYLKPYSIESYESIKTFKSSKLTVDNMLFILDEINQGNMKVSK